MAKGTATGESLVVSQVRTGCKRELQFMLKSQSEICGGESLGRTRGSRNSNSDSRSADSRKPPSRLRRSGVKKMRLVKDEEEEVVMSDSVEEDDVKSDVVDIDEGKGLISDSALVESEKVENVVVMNEDQSRELLEKGLPEVKEAEKECLGVVGREIVMACPADFSELARLTSRSCHVKSGSGLGYEKPGRRMTRSMLKSEGIKSEANVDDEDLINQEREAKCSEDSCVAEGSKSEANGDVEDLINQEREAKCSEDSCVAEGSKSEANVDDEDLINQEREAKCSEDSSVAEGSKSEANVDEEDHMNQESEGKCSEDSCVAEGGKSEANVDQDHINPEREVKCSEDSSVAEGSKSEDNVDEEDHMNQEREAKCSEDSCVAEGSISEANGDVEDLINQEREAKCSEDSCVAEGSICEANVDEDHINPEKVAKCSEDSCVDASTLVAYQREEELHEQISVDTCLGNPSGTPQTSGVDKKAVNGTVDKSLRRFTRSLFKQESDLEKPSLENHIEAAGLGKVDVYANDVEMEDFQSPSVTTPNRRGRPRKYLRSFPAKLKELFDSRILDGLTVYYLQGAKMREAGARGLKGVIRGSGVLCFCGACKGTQVVSPAVYEHHASSTNKRPPEYMLLESGCTLRDVMNAIKETPLATLEERLRLVVGPAVKKSSLCFNCQGPMVEPCETKSLFSCNSCFERKEPEIHTTPSKANGALKGSSNPSVVPKTILSKSISSPRQSSRREQPTKMSPEADVVSGSIRSESKSSSIKSNSQGRLTRKDVRLHKLVFEDDILPDGTEVGYFLAGKKLLVGYKKGFGIHCSCCNKVVSPSSFEAHAGYASRRKPFQHIYTTNGVSLHELSVVLSMDQRFSIRENDDLCSICKDGGELLCCDTCPRSYHIVCAYLPSLPSESTERWSCKHCVNNIEREKFVESNPNAIAAGRVDGVDAIAEITKRSIRIVSSLGSELPSVCVLCRGHSFCRLGFNSRTVIICDQCEKEFHVGCLKEHNIADLEELPEDKWFCSLGCKTINTSLGDRIVHGEEKLSNNFLNFIRKKQKPNEDSCPDDNTTPDIRWRVLSGKLTSSDDTKVLLAKALSILHERFDPISESGTRGDLIPTMVYGKKAKGQDFSGMYCTMLTVDEVIVSVGIFRIFGSELAELPLVATSRDCQGQGYFQCLFACIERLLGSLNVKHLVLPAADEAKSIWTDKFGFSKMTEEEVNEYRKDFSVMVFHGTSMLRKTVPAMSKPEEDSMELEE